MAAKLFWRDALNITSKKYSCGHCGNSISSDVGFLQASNQDGSGATTASIYICHHCNKPTLFDNMTDKQIPGAKFGDDVQGIDDNLVKSLYDEARNAFSQNAFTSVVLSCRKLLMHIAVAKGAKENLKFIQYVEYLSEQNYVPPGSKDWVDHIREKGNEATHEIVIMSKEEAEDLISFSSMLLKLIYEFPSKLRPKTKE